MRSSRPITGVLVAAVALVLFGLTRTLPGQPARVGQAQSQGAGLPGLIYPHAEIPQVFGFYDFAHQAGLDAAFLSVPDAKLARQHLKVLTAAPHWASSPEDYATALYVADQFKAAGLETEIVPYSVLLNKPVSVQIEAFDGTGQEIFKGPTREHVETADSRLQDDLRILPGFNGGSPSGDVTAEVVYANYGRLVDFRRLQEMGVTIKGKIVLVRYGGDFRGVKVYLAQQYGAKGVLIYSDPEDDGRAVGEVYPNGPYRPDSGVQRGSVQFLPIYPGDPTTPGMASVPGLRASERIPVDKLQYDLPGIPVNSLSAADAEPILRAMGGSPSPQDWQGALPFPYHLGGGAPGTGKAETVHMHLVQDNRLRTIWDVIGKIPGTAEPRQWVIAGNHRDAWVYGAADPGSGTAAMLEAVHGLGVLLKQGWRPRRTVIVASWDGEEEGLVGSTEWVEQHAPELASAVAYFNMDVAVSGASFSAAAVPSLREFIRDIAREVPSPEGGTVYSRWKKDEEEGRNRRALAPSSVSNMPPAHAEVDVHLGDLGSGSDYTPFLQHLGVPSTDIASDGPFGVYHTVFDNFDWFVRFADPKFEYTQQQARIFGLEMLHMADADVLPYDYHVYAEEIRMYLEQARSRAVERGMETDFTGSLAAVARFEAAAGAMRARQMKRAKDASLVNAALLAVERDLLLQMGLPGRPWYRHSVYAPGEFTGYAAVTIPWVNEGIDAKDVRRTQDGLAALTQALERATATLERGANGLHAAHR